MGLMPNATPKLNLGAPVQYLSRTQKAWVDTKVNAVHVNGAIMVECKPGDYWIDTAQQPSLIRRIHGRKSVVTRGLEGFEVGDKCHYFSTSQNHYVDAHIIA